jgi:hypothetical protein
MVDVIKVTDAGMSIVTNRLKDSGTTPHYVHWGIGTTGAANNDTAMESAGAHESRTAGTMTQQTTNVSNDTYQVVGTITCATATKAITEAGLFDASTSGNMFLRGTFSAINVNVADSIEFTIKAAFDQA